MKNSNQLLIDKNISSIIKLINKSNNNHHQFSNKFQSVHSLPKIRTISRSEFRINNQFGSNIKHFLSSTSDHTKNKTSVDEFINLTWWNDRSKGKFPGLIGLEILSISDGYVFSQLKIREELLAPNGYLHAGTVVTLADTACGYGCLKSLPSQAKLFTTIELKSNFLGTVKPPAVITCEARLHHGGKTTQVWDAQVKDSAKNKLIALFRCTQLIIY
jgi:uncharacterized protein (TIGR00369 family)